MLGIERIWSDDLICCLIWFDHSKQLSEGVHEVYQSQLCSTVPAEREGLVRIRGLGRVSGARLLSPLFAPSVAVLPGLRAHQTTNGILNRR